MLALTMMVALTCSGGGIAVKPDVKSVAGAGSFSGSYDYGRGDFAGNSNYSGTIYGTRERSYADQVDVEVDGANGRIRLPRVTLPLAHGGQGGWFELKNVEVTDRAIVANAAINFMNKPKVYIDRMTGAISIAGKSGDFAGQCQIVDASAVRRF